MTLGELIQLAEQSCGEEWQEYRIVVSISSDDIHYTITDNLKVTFDPDVTGELLLEENE